MGKILILANSSGGLYDFRNELLLQLLQKHEVVIGLPDQAKTKELMAQGCEIVETPINRRGMNPKEDVKLFLNYRSLIKKIKPDLILTYTIKPNIYGGLAARIKKTPYLTTITGLGGAFDRDGLFLEMIVLMYRVALKKANCVFFQNKQNQKIFAGYGIRGKKEQLVMGSGVNLERHCYEPFSPGEKTTFLFVGRVMKERGILEYLEAAMRLGSERTEFAIMGYCDEDFEDILNEYAEKGIVSLWGFQTEVHHYLTKASAIVVASFHEGMSNALIEAAATGRPVIASQISGCKEAFEEGKTGFGFEPGNAESLVKAMDCFLSLSWQEKEKMGQAARAKMEQEFDRRKVVECYIKMVDEIIVMEGK